MIKAFIGIGSNLNQPQDNVRQAILDLNNIVGVKVLCSSALYKSAPLGEIKNQPDFINAVVEISTSLSAYALLKELLALELIYGRVRKERWGPRTLDLDLLLYGSFEFADLTLTIPHPGIYTRNFVLKPLYDIAPDLVFPNGIKLQELAHIAIDLEQIT